MDFVILAIGKKGGSHGEYCRVRNGSQIQWILPNIDGID
jgi:hypothetical protein